MNAKIALRWSLLLVVFGSVALYAVKKSRADDAGSDAASPVANVTAAKVVVTYFTTDVRCESCHTIERLSRQAIEEGFPAEIDNGSVVFRVLNTDRAANEHFLDDYEVANKTVIVSRQNLGKEAEWINRQDVWLLLEEPDAFLSYVREPVQQYLSKN